MGQLRLPPETAVETKDVGYFQNQEVIVEAVSALPNKDAYPRTNGALLELCYDNNFAFRIQLHSWVYTNPDGTTLPVMCAVLYRYSLQYVFGTLAYDATTCRWWRIRELDGYYECAVSADRTEWSTVGAIYDPNAQTNTPNRTQLSGMNIRLAHVADRTYGDVVFDNLNIQPSIPESDVGNPRKRTTDYMRVLNNLGFDGRGVNVGICDQGTTNVVRQKLGAELASKTLPIGTEPELGADKNDFIAAEGGRHGCLVAACMIQPGMRLHDVVITPAGNSATFSAMASGIKKAVDLGAQVINLSYGGSPYFATAEVNDAVRYCNDKGRLLFASAGNDNGNLLLYPANLSESFPMVHSVGAVDERTDRKASFSNYAAAMTGVTPGAIVRGLMPNGVQCTWSGTSAAAPHAAGLAARMLTGGLFTPAQVGSALKRTRQPTLSGSPLTGQGKYDFQRALAVLLSEDFVLPRTNELERAIGFDLEHDIATVDEYELLEAVEPEDYIVPTEEQERAHAVLYSYGLRAARELDVAFPVQVRTSRPPLSVAPVERGGARVIAQSMVNGRFMHWDLPVVDLSIVETLSGPGAITGKLNPDVPDIRAVPLTPWGTWIHVEDEHGLIRASGILTTPFGVSGAERSLEAVGVSAWIKDITYDGAYGGYEVDPLDVVRGLWDHAQLNWPNGNLGVIVSSDTSQVRIGGKPPDPGSTLSGPRIEIGEGPQSTTQDGVETIEYKPYKLVWWEHTSIGGEIDMLAQNTPFDYVERSAWKPDRSGVDHFIDLRWPRAGTRRSDLRFADGENIKDSIPVTELDSAYVTDVRVFGAGEGQDMIVGFASTRAYPQVRRVVSITEKTIKSPKRAKAVAEAELLRRTQPRGMEKILIDAGHENAPVGSFSVGDDIFIQTEVDWLGEVNMWHRIVNFTYTPDEESVDLTVVPSSTFRYGNDA